MLTPAAVSTSLQIIQTAPALALFFLTGLPHELLEESIQLLPDIPEWETESEQGLRASSAHIPHRHMSTITTLALVKRNKK